MPMLFKSCCMVSIQFFRGLPGFLFLPLISQCTACLGSLLSSIRRTCLSHLSLLSFMMRSILSSCVCTLILLWLTVFPWDTHYSSWNLWCVAFSLFFCTTVTGHSSGHFRDQQQQSASRKRKQTITKLKHLKSGSTSYSCDSYTYDYRWSTSPAMPSTEHFLQTLPDKVCIENVPVQTYES